LCVPNFLVGFETTHREIPKHTGGNSSFICASDKTYMKNVNVRKMLGLNAFLHRVEKLKHGEKKQKHHPDINSSCLF
jgi:hypothetical protein